MVPGDTVNWTELTFTFDAGTIGGFDSTDLRDVWFYLDPGSANFAGNEFYFDYFSIGEAPDSATWSTCPGMVVMPPVNPPLYVDHWAGSLDPTFSGSGGAALTQTLDSTCSLLALSVTDTVNAPLPSFSPLIINPQLPGGAGDLADLSGNMSFHVRVKSLETVTLGLLLRAGDGSSALRTNRLEQIVPGDTTTWTELTYTFDASTIGGFDSTDLRDIWFYLDPGVDNFAGNAFYFDYFSIGAKPDSGTFSTCGDSMMTPPIMGIDYVLHYDTSTDPLLSGSAAATLTQSIDSACSQLFLTVSDTASNPWNGTSPVIINPQDTSGNDIMDLSGSMDFYLRVRSLDTVELAFLLRSGDGSSGFRTSRISQEIPGDTSTWTEVSFSFDTNTIGGFDSTDLRDIWLYLDFGEDNFAGNQFWIDYFAFGRKPDASTLSPCPLPPAFEFPWVLHWADTLDPVTSGSGAVQLTQTVDTSCSELIIAVTEPILDPHPPFRPIILNPQDEMGNDLSDLSGNLMFYARVRSLEEVDFAATLRGGTGSSDERTLILEQTIPGGLSQWTDVVFDFGGANLDNFDSTDLRDIFLYLNREEANFPGNEFHIDYVSLGSPPDANLNSTCVAVEIEDELAVRSVKMYPNPIVSGQTLKIEMDQENMDDRFSLLNAAGQLIYSDKSFDRTTQNEVQLVLDLLPAGLYLLRMTGSNGTEVQKLIIR
ncbi:MAG: T9SS type A sorting domain-containing protein [Bacteroidota bacterium]